MCQPANHVTSKTKLGQPIHWPAAPRLSEQQTIGTLVKMRGLFTVALVLALLCATVGKGVVFFEIELTSRCERRQIETKNPDLWWIVGVRLPHL